MATEESSYEVVQKLDGAEVRWYAPYVVAEVLVSGTAERAGSEAFPNLAGYTFGRNKGARKFDMTTHSRQWHQVSPSERQAQCQISLKTPRQGSRCPFERRDPRQFGAEFILHARRVVVELQSGPEAVVHPEVA